MEVTIPNPNGTGTITVKRGSCNSVSCKWICVKWQWGTELEDYNCYCDHPYMHGTEPGAAK